MQCFLLRLGTDRARAVAARRAAVRCGPRGRPCRAPPPPPPGAPPAGRHSYRGLRVRSWKRYWNHASFGRSTFCGSVLLAAGGASARRGCGVEAEAGGAGRGPFLGASCGPRPPSAGNTASSAERDLPASAMLATAPSSLSCRMRTVKQYLILNNLGIYILSWVSDWVFPAGQIGG